MAAMMDVSISTCTISLLWEMKSILMQTVFIIPAIQSQQQPRLYANNKHVKQTNKQTNKQTKKVQDRRVSQAYCKHVQFDELSF